MLLINQISLQKSQDFFCFKLLTILLLLLLLVFSVVIRKQLIFNDKFHRNQTLLVVQQMEFPGSLDHKQIRSFRWFYKLL